MSQWHIKFRKSKRARLSLYKKILERDKGICAICGKDNEALLELIRFLIKNPAKQKYMRHWSYEDIVKRNCLTESRIEQSVNSEHGRLWDMDHIVPISDSGQRLIENIRTVCVSCHLMISKIYYYSIIKKSLPEEVSIWIKQHNFSV